MTGMPSKNTLSGSGFGVLFVDQIGNAMQYTDYIFGIREVRGVDCSAVDSHRFVEQDETEGGAGRDSGSLSQASRVRPDD